MKVVDIIGHIGYYCSDPRNDGYSAFTEKQKLYEILWATEKELKKAPVFVGEDKWLKENAHAHKR
jgi:poly(3-hydroxyalkanoate) synthetase